MPKVEKLRRANCVRHSPFSRATAKKTKKQTGEKMQKRKKINKHEEEEDDEMQNERQNKSIFEEYSYEEEEEEGESEEEEEEGKKRRGGGGEEDEDEEEEEEIMPKKLAQKIMKVVKEQEENDKWESASVCSSVDFELVEKMPTEKKQKYTSGGETEKIKVDAEGFVFSDYHFEEEEQNFGSFFLSKKNYTQEKSNKKEEEKEKEEKEKEKNKNENHSCFEETRNLADLILEKIRQKNENEKMIKQIHLEHQEREREKNEEEEDRLRKVEEVYRKVGEYLSHYKSGKLPKAFKILPKLANWENILYMTNPLKWTPQAMHRATRIFASSLNQKLAQRFFNLVLLPAVREDISKHRKLNYHYYQALIKAFFKPAAWFKGILIPLMQQGCTLRECVIIGSVMAKASIPVLHSSACIIKLCNTKPWSGPLSFMLTTLINKKYSLPLKVIDSLMEYFYEFISDEREMPVVWHQTILVFVQRYKYELKESERHRLHELVKVHFHPKISPEIRRELHIGGILNCGGNANCNYTQTFNKQTNCHNDNCILMEERELL